MQSNKAWKQKYENEITEEVTKSLCPDTFQQLIFGLRIDPHSPLAFFDGQYACKLNNKTYDTIKVSDWRVYISQKEQ